MADPVVPKTLEQDYAIAANSGDVALLDDVKQRSMGTPVAPKAQAQIDRLSTGVAPIEKALSAVQAKGGIETRDGRIEAANQALQSFKEMQPETSFFKGFTQGLMGNPKWRDAATQGVVRPVVRFGNDGSAVTAYMVQNSDIPIRVVKDGKDLNMQEYMDGGYQYEKPTEAPAYMGKQATFQRYAEQNAKEQLAANVGAAISAKRADNASFVLGAMQKLREFGLSNEELNQLTEESTREFSNSYSIRTGMEQLKNAQDSDAIRSALDVMNGSGVGLDGKVFSLDANNKIVDQNGKNYTVQGLLQMGSSYNNSSERQKRFTQAREQILESAILKKLPNEQAKAEWQQAMDRINQNYELAAEFKQKYGGLPFISDPTPFKPGQSMKVAMANALQEITNADLAQKYQEFYAQNAKKGFLIPGSTAAAFVRNPEMGYQQSLGRLNEDIAKINSLPAPQSAQQPVVTRELQAPSGGLQNIMTPEQQGRLGKTVGQESLSKTPAGVPSGAKLTDRRTPPSKKHPNGQAIYELGGKQYVAD